MVIDEPSTSGRLQASEGFLGQGLTLFEKYCRPYMTALVKCGPVPGHIAFIMDGNRRFATRHHQISAAGHQFGYYKVGWIGSNQVVDTMWNLQIYLINTLTIQRVVCSSWTLWSGVWT